MIYHFLFENILVINHIFEIVYDAYEFLEPDCAFSFERVFLIDITNCHKVDKRNGYCKRLVRDD